MLNKVDIDTDAMVNGVWTYLKCSEFKIASVHSRSFVKILMNLKAEDNYTPEQFIDVLAKHILLSWKKVYDYDDQLVEYSTENAKIALTNSPELFVFVTEFSADLSNYLEVRNVH